MKDVFESRLALSEMISSDSFMRQETYEITDEYGSWVARIDVKDEATAAEIVHRVNTYSDLYEALKRFEEMVSNLNGDVPNEVWNAFYEPMKQARAALAKHEGRQ